MTNEELRRLATEAKGWMETAVIKDTNFETGQMCEIGGVSPDDADDFNPFITLDCENYGTDSKPLAEYIIAACVAVPALLADLDALRTRLVELETQEHESQLHLERATRKADAALTRLAEVEKDGRAIRRMLCLSVAHMPYMDDGEASDQEIDFMRDSSADIEKKLMERNLKKYAAMGAQA